MARSSNKKKRTHPKPTQASAALLPDRPQNDTPPADAPPRGDRAANDPEAESKRVDRLRAAVDEAAKHVVHRYTTFLLVTVYLAITIGSTTDEQLLRESPLPLPLLGVGLPIVPFYAVMPLFYLLLHVNLLLQLCLLSQKLGALKDQVLELIPKTGEPRASARADLRTFGNSDKLLAATRSVAAAEARAELALIHPFAFNHMLLRTADSRRVRALLRAVVWITIVAGPVVMLLWAQRQFLPYHSTFVTWLHRLYVLGDLFVLWLYWPTIMRPYVRPAPATIRYIRLRRIPRFLLSWFARLGIAFGSVCILAVPDETCDLVTPTTTGALSSVPYLRDGLFGNARPIAERLLHRNLDLAEKTLVAEAPPSQTDRSYIVTQDDVDRPQGLDLRGRDLRYANFSKCDLTCADLRGANLEHASLVGATLRMANFSTLLHIRNPKPTRLSNATFRHADLRGASLAQANLRYANLAFAKLQGAELSSALLHFATLQFSSLHGADLCGAELHGADLFAAKLHGTNLKGANLSGAQLAFSTVHGADLRDAIVAGVDFSNVLCFDSDLRELRLHSIDERREAVLVDWDSMEVELRNKTVDPVTRSNALARIVYARAGQPECTVGHFVKFARNVYDTNVCFADSQEGTQPQQPDHVSYNKELAAYLVRLACEGPWTANGVARYVFSLFPSDFRFMPLVSDEQEDGFRGATIARALLDARQAPVPCEPLKNLPADTVDQLQKVIEVYETYTQFPFPTRPDP